MAGGHGTKPTSWITVLLIIAAAVLFGFALPMDSWGLAIAGAVALVAGIVTGAVFRIMDDAY
jgi:membrane-bound ClpP family serine protease